VGAATMEGLPLPGANGRGGAVERDNPPSGHGCGDELRS
jgi:hypothetical protein